MDKKKKVKLLRSTVQNALSKLLLLISTAQANHRVHKRVMDALAEPDL